MTTWRDIALDFIPTEALIVHCAHSPWDLAFALRDRLPSLYADPSKEHLLNRIYELAAWFVWRSEDMDLSTAFALGFYEHLVDIPAAKLDLPARLTLEEFRSLESVYRYWMKDEFDEFKTWFETQRLMIDWASGT